MKIFCKLFGHRPIRPGWWGDVPYAKISGGYSDNLGTIHGTFHHECDRCGEEYLAGRFHMTNERILSSLKRHGKIL